MKALGPAKGVGQKARVRVLGLEDLGYSKALAVVSCLIDFSVVFVAE
jgi:hypothetical protein